MITLDPTILHTDRFKTLIKSGVQYTFQKKEKLLLPGQHCRYLYLIECGLMRSYYYDLKGNDITHWFASESMLMTIPPSFFYNEANVFGIEALEHTKVIVFTYDELEEILESSKYMERVFRITVTQIMVTLGKKVIDLQTKTALTRYKELLCNFPKIFNRVPLGHIASYLGITQQSLSRIRAQIHR